MSLDLRDCTFAGPAMPEPFVKYRLEELLTKKKLLGKATGEAGKKLSESWQTYRNKLRSLGEQGGDKRVLNHVLEPLVERLGWSLLDSAARVTTREGQEEGGYLLRVPPADGEAATPHLRAWVFPVGTDLDAPNKRGRAYRFSPGLVAQRVLLAKGERIGVLTDGLELRILLSDPSGRDSHIGIRLDRSGGWRAAREVPDSFRLLRALCQPEALSSVADLLNDARLSQTSVTKKLREQTRRAVEEFIQGVLEDPANAEARKRHEPEETAQILWREGLVLVYRLLFILKLETSPDPARAFSFAATSLWRNSYSPSTALAPVVERIRDRGADTGEFLAHSLRALFRLFSHGLASNELHVSPLGGMLFGREATPLLDSLHWSDQAVAKLLDALLWTPAEKKGKTEQSSGRERVHYGALDVEDLGRVYEALLELEPGIATEPMCRLRRAKLEVVIPLAQGASYREAIAAPASDEKEDVEENEEGDVNTKGKIVFDGEVADGRFYLRVGLGRKASGSYYTPHPFVRFLVQETLGPQVTERSPQEDPNPLAILGLRVLDPAMGSGHFLVEACRFLGDALYEACRLCDERALEAQRKAEGAKTEDEREKHVARGRDLWKRVEDLPDPNDELVAYLPSRTLDNEESGLSQRKALALCRRLVAVHCLYGVDKNPLAVELARVSLWLESYAEGLPLTFLEHRLVLGDSLTGPFFEQLLSYPGTGERINNLFAQGVTEKLTRVLVEALAHVRDLEATIGKDVADIELKRIAKNKLDGALQPLKILAAAWSGGVMLGKDACDDAGYEHLLRSIAEKEDPDAPASSRPGVSHMVQVGMEGVPYDLVFPEVFYPEGRAERAGFHAVVGNPPWDLVELAEDAFWANFDLRALEVVSKNEREPIIRDLMEKLPFAADRWRQGTARVEQELAYFRRAYVYQSTVVEGSKTTGRPDAYRVFVERAVAVAAREGFVGLVLPSSLHGNEGATALRQYILAETSLKFCLSFENRRKLFEIDSRQKFDALVLRRGEATHTFRCAFYLLDPEALSAPEQCLTYSAEYVRLLGGPQLAFPECRDQATIDILAALYRQSGPSLGSLAGISFSPGVELHRNPAFDNRIGTPGDLGVLLGACLPVHLPIAEGKNFWQFADAGEQSVARSVPTCEALRKEKWRTSIGFFRLAYRTVASSTNERTVVVCVLPPGVIVNHSVGIEDEPDKRPNSRALSVCAVLNSFVFDWQARQRVDKNVSAYILRELRIFSLAEGEAAFLAHATLRLCARHRWFKPIWLEQLEDEWKEQQPKYGWPVLEDDGGRWAVRASIEAVVADAYGLDRDQYRHVLSSFSHKIYPQAPELCLEAFDELRTVGFAAFAKKHDPYWDIPLVTTLPKPVIDLPAGEPATSDTFQLTPAEAKPKKGKTKKGGTS